MPTIVRDMPPEVEQGNTAALNDKARGASSQGVVGDNVSKFSPTVAIADAAGGGATVDHSVATLSNPWEFDVEQPYCTSCRDEFHPFNRRHHCRLCGKIFCNRCSDQRALVPPSAIVLTPKGGKKAAPQYQSQTVSFSPDPDPDRMLTYVDEDRQLLYGKGLEERFHLAREPLRVCMACHEQLQPLQAELRNANSNAMRFNHIDPTDPKRFLNSPLAFTLGHEVRKAAYALNNLLPSPKRMGSVVDVSDNFLTGDARDIQTCKDECAGLTPNLSNMDGIQIPAKLLEQAKGVAVMTVVKGGFGLAGVEFGTGLVVARIGDQQWSAPCAIGTAGVSWGALLGAQISDHVFLLMTDAAVELMFNSNGNIQLGADVGVAVGPVGRALEADFGASPGSFAPVYTYSLSKGLYAGVSLDGKVIVTRHRVNEKFYGREVSGLQLLSGEIPSPPAARPLYEALQRCHVYATGNRPIGSSSTASAALFSHPQTHTVYGLPGVPQSYPSMTQSTYSAQHLAEKTQNEQVLQQLEDHMVSHEGLMPPASSDQHSYAGMSDITSDPGY